MSEIQRFATERTYSSALRVPRPIEVFQAQTTAGTVVTARDDADFQIEALYAVNASGTADSITLYLVPDGGTAGADNLILFEKSVPASDIIAVFDRERMGLLIPGMSLQALCGVNDSVNLFGYGYDYQGVYE